VGFKAEVTAADARVESVSSGPPEYACARRESYEKRQKDARIIRAAGLDDAFHDGPEVRNLLETIGTTSERFRPTEGNFQKSKIRTIRKLSPR